MRVSARTPGDASPERRRRGASSATTSTSNIPKSASAEEPRNSSASRRCPNKAIALLRRADSDAGVNMSNWRSSSMKPLTAEQIELLRQRLAERRQVLIAEVAEQLAQSDDPRASSLRDQLAATEDWVLADIL